MRDPSTPRLRRAGDSTEQENERMRSFQIRIYLPELVYQFGLWILLFYRRIRYGYGFRKIGLTQGKFAIVDEEDYDRLNQYKWCAVKGGDNFYANRNGGNRGKLSRTFIVKMHREVLNDPPGMIVDHINHNGLDNRKANLRIVTKEQNLWNSRKNISSRASRYKGVSFCKRDKRWRAHITYKKKRTFIGSFLDEQAAAKAYDEKAKQLFGEFAFLNFGGQKQ